MIIVCVTCVFLYEFTYIIILTHDTNGNFDHRNMSTAVAVLTEKFQNLLFLEIFYLTAFALTMNLFL